MFANQGDVEYVYINQATGEYKIIPESEVSVCQSADGATLLVYAGAQQEPEEQEIAETSEEGGDIVYVDTADEGIEVQQCVEHDESLVEVRDDGEIMGELVEDSLEENEHLEDSEDTRFVMVSEQEVLVVKKGVGASRNKHALTERSRSRATINPEARLMKARRRVPPQSQKKGPKLIQDFLLPHLDNGTFGNRLVWVDRPAGTFAMSWSHKNGAEWRADDCIVFREWDRLKQRDVTESHRQYWMEAKQRFRSALAKVSTPCTIDSEEFKSSKVFQIKWTRETRPDILERTYTASKYFELPPRGSMGKPEAVVRQEEVHDGFLVETYTEEEVVASSGTAYSPNGINFNIDSQEIEVCTQQDVEEQVTLDAAVSSVTLSEHSAMMTEDVPAEKGPHLTEDFGTSAEVLVPSAHYAAAQQAAAAVLSSRFFTENKRRKHKHRSIRRESLTPVQKILRRCKKLFNRVYTICPLCRFFSSSYAILLRHLMVHRDEHAFACLHCTASFKLPELLLHHLQDHHNAGNPKVCFLSNLEAKTPAKLRRAELKLVHRNLCTCSVCAEHCLTQHDLLEHVQQLHGIEAVQEVKRGARAARRRSRIRMRRRFINIVQPNHAQKTGRKRRRRSSSQNCGSARTGGELVRSRKHLKLLSNDENQTSLVVCDGEVLIEEAPIDWGEQVLE